MNELEEAKRELEIAQKKVNNLQREIDQREIKLRLNLPVGKNIPCNTGVLPDGRIAVHVWVESSSEPNQLHIVEPRSIDEKGEPRDRGNLGCQQGT